MKNKTRIILILMTVAVAILFTMSGTLAFLVDETEPVKNTFTYGDINIDLKEKTSDYKMVPGNQIDKDPTVTVESGSEACWLFVKVEKSTNFDNFMTCAIADGWTALTGVPGVYYREVASTAEDTSFDVLSGDKVSVKDTVTKAMFNALTVDNYPTLTFTAYAVQKDNVSTAAAAWAIINPNTVS